MRLSFTMDLGHTKRGESLYRRVENASRSLRILFLPISDVQLDMIHQRYLRKTKASRRPRLHSQKNISP